MAEVLKGILMSRGVQLLSRYAGVGLAYLGAKAQVTIPDADAVGASNAVALLVAGGVCLLVDLISHKFQKDDEK